MLLRSAGCTINDLWDRDLDRAVERTRSRPLASGALQPRHAIGGLLPLACCRVMGMHRPPRVESFNASKRLVRLLAGLLGAQLAAGLGVLVQLNPFSQALGAASLGLVATYPLMKRITGWPQVRAALRCAALRAVLPCCCGVRGGQQPSLPRLRAPFHCPTRRRSWG